MNTEHRAFSAEPSVYAALSLQAGPDAPLSAMQQRYNALLARLEVLSAHVARL